jgi:hypothetical protein
VASASAVELCRQTLRLELADFLRGSLRFVCHEHDPLRGFAGRS